MQTVTKSTRMTVFADPGTLTFGIADILVHPLNLPFKRALSALGETFSSLMMAIPIRRYRNGSITSWMYCVFHASGANTSREIIRKMSLSRLDRDEG